MYRYTGTCRLPTNPSANASHLDINPPSSHAHAPNSALRPSSPHRPPTLGNARASRPSPPRAATPTPASFLFLATCPPSPCSTMAQRVSSTKN
ncbi:hypothetical protein COCC4DRAFT_127771 [Bipolaris maydis ATCC 48331]|uniref:Uncharacterized protein n=2 Tax=Cochliobolus heterostrophus TaxID=5016 RepID=M2SY08_COCH5|nr:uncharacterized protein COCC4DRAFT_127771 [Bipolaris maydis ATCC 48331]EMD90265.1 hypothetical protein COCHEDRAFT_1157283 [Bipolaris maydis C5]ENI09521.1 hypothetical protein COCC4DRAFT_127771 [Bipolaris maydis ATCC 48331]